MKSYTSNSNTIEDDVAAYEREIEKYMQASLESTQRSAQQLSNSEKMAENTIRVVLHICFDTVFCLDNFTCFYTLKRGKDAHALTLNAKNLPIKNESSLT